MLIYWILGELTWPQKCVTEICFAWRECANWTMSPSYKCVKRGHGAFRCKQEDGVLMRHGRLRASPVCQSEAGPQSDPAAGIHVCYSKHVLDGKPLHNTGSRWRVKKLRDAVCVECFQRSDVCLRKYSLEAWGHGNTLTTRYVWRGSRQRQFYQDVTLLNSGNCVRQQGALSSL